MADNKNTNSGLSESCFVIMPISDQEGYPKGHFTNIYNQIFIPAIKEAGFTPYRVDENAICDSIINKIFDAIQQCPIALCDLSSRNPNVLYELGLRQAYDKPVVLVQDEKTDRIFDVSGISTVSYKSDRLFENVIQAREGIKIAIKETAEKKNNSLVRIVKSQSANFDSVTLSNDDKTEIMFNRIMGELTTLKQRPTNDFCYNNCRDYYGNIQFRDEEFQRDKDLSNTFHRLKSLLTYICNSDFEEKQLKKISKEFNSEKQKISQRILTQHEKFIFDSLFEEIQKEINTKAQKTEKIENAL